LTVDNVAITNHPLPVAAAVDPAPVKSAPGTQRVYRPELDALRFFAFFCVYLNHTMNTGSDGGFARHFPFIAPWYPLIQQSFSLGLCLFFFLSSYLITSLLRIEEARTGTVDLRKFYVRRVLRIWPLYLTFLLFSAVLCIVWPAAGRIEPGRLLAMLLLAGNWYAVFAGTGARIITHLWSISVEEQFYLVWPSISRIASARLLGAICIAISAAALGTTWLLFAHGSTILQVWQNSIPQSLFFATGALFALLIGMREQRPSLPLATLFIASGYGVWLLTEKISGNFHGVIHTPLAYTGGYALAAAGCALLLLGFLHLPRYLLVAPLLYLGRISYGLYVFHELFIECTRNIWPQYFRGTGVSLLASMVMTLVAAMLSYQFLEKPFLKLKSRFELVHTRIA